MKHKDKTLQELLRRGYRYAYSLTHDATQAEDLVQEACVKILKAKGPWHKGYLFTAIRNCFIDRIKKQKRLEEIVHHDDDVTDNNFIENVKDDFSFDVMIDTMELEKALKRLSDSERELYYLFTVETMSAGQISKLLDIPRGTVLSSVHRTRKKLQALLSQGAFQETEGVGNES